MKSRSPSAIGIASLLARAYVQSLRVRLNGDIPQRGVIVLWHADLAVAMKAFSGRGIHVLLSASSDGEIAARAAQSLGYRVQRGSSGRQGSQGLRRILRAARQSPGLIGMALDGPRGPRGMIKPGSLWLARELNLPLLPVGISVSGGWRLSKSWDQALLPWPWLGSARLNLGPALAPTCSAPELALAMQAVAFAAAN